MDIFRKSALEKLSSPEQLDLMVTVTSPRGWIALLGIGGILLVTLLWSIFGALPDKVSGSGIMIRGGAIYDVVALGTGRVTEVRVQPGDIVTAGQVVALVSDPELLLRVNNIQKQLQALIKDDEELAAADVRRKDLELAASNKESENLSQAREDALKMIGFLKEKVAVQESLMDKGVITKTSLLSTRKELITAQQEVARNENQISQLLAQRTTVINTMQERAQDRRRGIENSRRQLSEAESQLKQSGEVVSPYAGRVLELMLDRGNIVQGGTRVLSLEDPSASLRGVIFIPAADGKVVEPGMEIRIAPTTVKREEFGSILGNVKSVADFPSTQEGVNRTLRNPELAGGLMGKGPVIEVFADLMLDPKTTSGYKWSSSKGPPLRVASGTLAEAEIVIGKRRPISIIIPFLRKSSGIY